MWLRRRTPGWDALAGASAEISLLFAAITLGTGSLWGRPTWGTYWTWDARLTSTALLTALLVGYLALRRLDVDPTARSTRAAVLGLLLVPNVIIVNRSVEWWRSLHQRSTLVKLDPTIEGQMLVALMVGFLAVGLVFTWLLVHRFRVAWLEYQSERLDLDLALAERRAEAGHAGEPAERRRHDGHDARRLHRRRVGRRGALVGAYAGVGAAAGPLAVAAGAARGAPVELTPRTFDDTGTDGGGGAVAPGPAGSRRRRRRWVPLVVLGVVLVALGVLVFKGSRTPPSTSATPTRPWRSARSLGTKRFRLQGR